MRVSILAGVVFLAASAFAQPAPVQLNPDKPSITIVLNKVRYVEALMAITKDVSIEFELDSAIPFDVLNREMTARFVNAPVKDVLLFLTRQAELTYRIIDRKKIRIEKEQ